MCIGEMLKQPAHRHPKRNKFLKDWGVRGGLVRFVLKLCIHLRKVRKVGRNSKKTERYGVVRCTGISKMHWNCTMYFGEGIIQMRYS